MRAIIISVLLVFSTHLYASFQDSAKIDTVKREFNKNINKYKISIPDGEYIAWRSGYEIEIEISGKPNVVVKDLLQGVRGLNVRTIIVIKNGFISIK